MSPDPERPAAENPGPEDDERDDEALSWAGDEAAGLAPRPRASASAPSTDTAPGETPAPTAAGPLSVVATGVLVGLYLLYTVGWIVGVARDPYSLANLGAEIMYQFGEFLAIAAPAVWFGAATLLTRGRRPLIRLGWLVLGAVVLVPWPLLLEGAYS